MHLCVVCVGVPVGALMFLCVLYVSLILACGYACVQCLVLGGGGGGGGERIGIFFPC